MNQQKKKKSLVIPGISNSSKRFEQNVDSSTKSIANWFVSLGYAKVGKVFLVINYLFTNINY